MLFRNLEHIKWELEALPKDKLTEVANNFGVEPDVDSLAEHLFAGGIDEDNYVIDLCPYSISDADRRAIEEDERQHARSDYDD